MSYAKSVATRARLLDATARLIRRRGYHATGLAEIVSESGVPKGSLYHHFPGGKEELAVAGVRHGGVWIVGSVERRIDESGSVAAGVAAFCDHYVESLERTGYQAGCPVATITLEAASESDGIQQAVGSVFSGLVELITDRLRREGVHGAAARSSAFATVSAIEGALIVARATRSTEAMETVRDQLVTQIESLERNQMRRNQMRRNQMRRNP